ncbi:PaaI family thioesterase [Caulobacter sp. NIBR2454]|uniref:PaaI family thioesterase n=1 Tax=Caulobacter sp. NIBR2454 TaxID=3015996 RepID=UPI0022B68129|nr:PaaI family thioesterase [Caulobacter sp. NIBR2454]
MTDSAVFEQVADKVRAALHAQGLFRHMGAEVAKVQPGWVEIVLPFREEVAQHNGFFHGGAVGFVVDIACAAAAGTVLRSSSEAVLTAEYKLNIVAAARSGRLVCRAEVIKPGRLLIPVEAKVHVIDEAGVERLVAVGLATMAVVSTERVAA